MKVIADSNVVVSAILNKNSKTGQLLIFGRRYFDFFAPNLLKMEIKKHKAKLLEISKLTEEEFDKTQDELFECLTFISEEQIDFEHWHNAIPIVRDIDMDDIAMDKVRQNWNEVDDLQKRRDRLHDLIDTYIGKPSLLRNKIAHGQWKIALNRENTAVNTPLTSEIDTLNVVEITKWYEIHQFLCFIVRDLIQSPRKGFYNNYWVNLVNLQQFIDESASCPVHL